MFVIVLCALMVTANSEIGSIANMRVVYYPENATKVDLVFDPMENIAKYMVRILYFYELILFLI